MQGKKEELREFKFSRKLMEELPDTVQEEREHRGLRREKRDLKPRVTEAENRGLRGQDTKGSGVKIGTE